MRIYNGLHAHHAMACLKANERANAVSWMFLDLAEETGSCEMPVPETLAFGYMDGAFVILYETENEYWENLQGAGI